MAIKKKTTLLVRLASTAIVKTKADGAIEERSSGYFYVKKRNPKRLVNKLSFRKYDPVVRRHVIFKEEKLK